MSFTFTGLRNLKEYLVREISTGRYNMQIDGTKNVASLTVTTPSGNSLELKLKNVSTYPGVQPQGTGFLDSLEIKLPFGTFKYS